MKDFRIRTKSFEVEYTEDGEFIIHYKGQVVEIYPEGVLAAIVDSFNECQDKDSALASNSCVDIEAQQQIELENAIVERRELVNLLREVPTEDLARLVAKVQEERCL